MLLNSVKIFLVYVQVQKFQLNVVISSFYIWQHVEVLGHKWRAKIFEMLFSAKQF